MAHSFVHTNYKPLRLAHRLTSCFRARRVFKHTQSIITGAGQQIYKPKTIFRRPLDALETLTYEYYKRNIQYTIVYASLKSKVSLKEETVRQALAMVSQRQPLLRATVIESPNSKEKYFECIHGCLDNNIDLCVMDRDIDDKVAVTEELMMTKHFYRDGEPLWRTVLLREKFDGTSNCYRNALILILSQSVAYAATSILLYQQLLNYIEAITRGTAIKVKDIPGLPLLPSSSTLLSHKLRKFPKSTMFSSSLENESYINPVLSDFPTIDSSGSHLKTEPFTKVMLRTLSVEKLTKLVMSCRNHNCTLTGAFIAACHIAFCSLLKTKPLPSHLTNDIICLTSTVKDHFATLPQDYISNHYGTLSYNLSLTENYENVWEIAQWCSKTIHSDVSKGNHLKHISMLESEGESFLNHMLQQGKLKLANSQRSSHMVSNATSFFVENHPNNAFHSENLFGGSPSHVRIRTFANFVTTVNGVLNMMTTYDGSIISSEVAKRYYDCIGEILENVMLESSVHH